LLPDGYGPVHVALPGVLAVGSPRSTGGDSAMRDPCEGWISGALAGFPLITLVDDAEFTARSLRNWLWVTFTRANPAADIDGFGAFAHQKHWGCEGPLVIDARIKPHHAPPLEDDPQVQKRIDKLAAPGGPLHGIL
jgi:4-hydroxy-3-polyprenylbenzoate decarboxylase